MTVSLTLGAKNYVGHVPLDRVATLRLTGQPSGEALLVTEWEVEDAHGLTTRRHSQPCQDGLHIKGRWP